MDSVTHLFCQNSVNEMKDLENKTRREIELKKEELRQMVGERYRDLIEAADTISEMKRCSKSIKTSIQDLQQFTLDRSTAQRRQASQTSQNRNTKEHKRYMEIAAETKILMDMPERIWLEVEDGNVINASYLYLESLQVVNNLSLSGSNAYSPILSWFPMLGQQAQAVGNLGAAILKKCRSRLGDHLCAAAKTAEAACSIVLLEKASVSDVFEALLKSRKQAIADIFDSDGATHRNAGAKARICASVSVAVQTVLQVSELFCQGAGGAVAGLLRRCSSQSAQDVVSDLLDREEASTIWRKYLPTETTQNLPTLDAKGFEIEPTAVQRECRAWLADIAGDLKRGIRQLLQFTACAKDLANIRSALMDTLNVESVAQHTGRAPSGPDSLLSVDLEPSPAPSSKWSAACRAVVGADVQLWNDHLRAIFIERIDELVRSTFERLLEQSKQVFARSRDTDDDQSDASGFVWQEHESDVAPTMAWTQWQNRRNAGLELTGGLVLKARMITPGVSDACRGVNAVVLELLDDLAHYAPAIRKDQAETRLAKHSPSANREEDATVVGHLKENCSRFLKSLLKHIGSVESELTTSVETQLDESAQRRVLHLSFVCRNFFTICPAFRQCCCPESRPTSHHVSTKTHFHGARPSARGGDVDSAEAAWNEVVAQMNTHCSNFMGIWCDSVLKRALGGYLNQLTLSVSGGSLLPFLATWDSVTVEEESESGKMVKSRIAVPSSVTTFTMDFLHAICSEITAIGGFSTGRVTLRNLTRNCLDGVLRAFSELRHKVSGADASLHGQSRAAAGAEPVPSQTWALQCLFDLRYMHTLLYLPPSAAAVRAQNKDPDGDLLGVVDEDDDCPSYTYTELVDWLEGYVDPFDLDVFSPHLTRNIQRHIQRTSVMFGLLVGQDRAGTSGALKFGVSKDSHNVLPLAVDCGRFSSLPISSRSSRSHQRLASPLARQLPMAHALRGLTRSARDDDDDASLQSDGQQKNLTSSLYSKLGALGSSWLSMSSSYTEG